MVTVMATEVVPAAERQSDPGETIAIAITVRSVSVIVRIVVVRAIHSRVPRPIIGAAISIPQADTVMSVEGRDGVTAAAVALAGVGLRHHHC